MVKAMTNYNYSHNRMNIRPNIWKSGYNPNVIFVSGRINAGNDRIGIVTEMLDLRKANCKRWKLLSLYDIDDDLSHNNHYGNVSRLVL